MQRVLRGVLLLPLLVAGASCTRASEPSPRPLAVRPSSGASAQPLALTIEGENFNPLVRTDFSRKSRSALDASFKAFLGDTELQQVALSADGTLQAVLPQGVPTGSFDLRVETPDGRSGTLPNAFRVVTSAESAASFVIEPVGTQRAGIPFSFGIAAIDSEGRVVEAFTGGVQLSAPGNNISPTAVGPFVLGRLRGAQITLSVPAQGQRLVVDDALGHRGESAPFEVIVGPPQTVALTSPQSAVAGGCAGPFEVSLRDAANNSAAASGAESMSVEFGPPLGVALFADDLCAQPVSSVLLSTGASSARFFVRFTRAGAVLVRVVPTGLPSAVASLDVDAGTATQLGFVTPSRVASAGACTGVIVVSALDAFGNLTQVSAPTAVSVEAVPDAGVSVFSDACTTPLTSPLTLTRAAPTALVQLSAPTPRQLELRISATGLSGASQPELFEP